MLSSFILREFRNKKWLTLFLFLSHFSNAQSDSLPYRSFSEKVVLFSDLGYASAPFSMYYSFPLGIERVKYRNNFRPVIGFGVAYKWFAIRLGISLPIQVRSAELYGRTEQLNLNADFTIKKTFLDFDLRSYRGYALKDAYRWDNSLTSDKPNDIQQRMNAASLSFNLWYFNNPHFKMANIRGRSGHYTKETYTWYVKNTLNFFGVGNDKKYVIPTQLHDTLNSRTQASIYSAIDLGVIPGFAYVNRIKNWQFSGSFGFGPVIQAKFYSYNENTRGFLGLAPRYDLRLIGGYNVERYYIMFITDFDNKSIRFNDLKYRQSYYSIKISAGMRIKTKKEKDSVKKTRTKQTA